MHSLSPSPTTNTIISLLLTITHHRSQSFSIICHHLPSYTIIHSHTRLFSFQNYSSLNTIPIIRHYPTSFTNTGHHSPSFPLTHHHWVSFTITRQYHLVLLTIICHHSASFTIIYNHSSSITIIHHNLPVTMQHIHCRNNKLTFYEL